MKYVRRIVTLMLCFCAISSVAKTMQSTIYADGVACPGDCDAHVVLNKADNGTRYAFAPGSSRRAPKRCASGQSCTICFSDSNDACMTVLYRGSGPPKGRFDFTPAFYDEYCPRGSIPEALKAQCRAFDAAVKDGHYNERVNCFVTPSAPECKPVMAAASAAYATDLPKRRECIAIGVEAFNRKQTDANERRSSDCNYSALPLGGSKTRAWLILRPAACPAGTFVDRYGLDCCNADVRFAAVNAPECDAFFPKRKTDYPK